MIISPWRWVRRRRRIVRQALDEAWCLRRRHGDAALLVANEKLRRSDLTRWGRDVLREAMRLLRSKKIQRDPTLNNATPTLLTESASNDHSIPPIAAASAPIPFARPSPSSSPPHPSMSLMDAIRAGRGLGPPALAVSPPGEPGRLFIVSQRARRIHILHIDGGAMSPTPFLTLADDRPADEEYRLLGVAFRPDYALHGRFFVYLIDQLGTVEVREYTRADADHADPCSARTIMWFHHPFARAGVVQARAAAAAPDGLNAWPDGEVPEIGAAALTFDGLGRIYAIGPDGEVRRLKVHVVVGPDRGFDAGLSPPVSLGGTPRGFGGIA